MKDDKKVHATDTLKDLGHDASHHAKEAAQDMKATMQADYNQTKEDLHSMKKPNMDEDVGDNY